MLFHFSIIIKYNRLFTWIWRQIAEIPGKPWEFFSRTIQWAQKYLQKAHVLYSKLFKSTTIFYLHALHFWKLTYLVALFQDYSSCKRQMSPVSASSVIIWTYLLWLNFLHLIFRRDSSTSFCFCYHGYVSIAMMTEKCLNLIYILPVRSPWVS